MSRSLLCGVLSACLALLPVAGQAAVIGTHSFVSQQAAPPDARERLRQELDRTELRAQLRAMGVEPRDVERRLDNLTPAELAQLNAAIGELPAGAGIVEVVGVVFIVLIILELVGVTNIFNSF